MLVSRSLGFMILISVLLLLTEPSPAGWLEFGPGCPENSEPRTVHNITLEDFISFDVELNGIRADTIEHDGTDYVSFNRAPGTRPMEEVGYPELPVVTCFVAVPDESDLMLDYSAGCMSRLETIPVYPAPLDSLVEDSTCTPRYEEFFRKDSAAYVSDEWYPGDIAVLSGEFVLRDQRVAIVDVYPVQYLASEDSLRVWSDIEVSFTFEGADPVWNEAGLGYYDRLIGDRLLGYTPSYSYEPITEGEVYRPEDLVAGPPVVPDYVMIVPDGMDGRWIDDFGEYRAALNGFDVAIATTGDIYDQFNEGSQYLTPDVIRNFTESMWDWGTPGDRPSYLLLIGDHEDYSCMVYPWFLPTMESCEHGYGNDEWYVYFGESREVISSFPDMMVGRLPARDSDKLRDMFDLIYDYESEDVLPGSVNRRRIVRLAGTHEDGSETNGEDNWGPATGWTSSFCQWLGYDLENYYCGDGEDTWTSDPPNPDGSSMTSDDWVHACTAEFEQGSHVAIYSDHGDFHMFSAGLNWEIGGPPNFGAPDSTFDDIDVMNLISDENHWHPFLLMLCCSAGTFNHTSNEHAYLNVYQGLCYDPYATPPYDFLSDCLAEDFMLNTDGGAIGVFAGSNSSGIDSYVEYGEGILETIYERGITRTGDAIAASRILGLDYFLSNSGQEELAQFNLLGDPAVDIGDRIKFRDRCDLIISPADLTLNRYPTFSVNGTSGEPELQITVRNAGAVASGPFDVTLDVTYEEQIWHLLTACPSLDPGEENTLQFLWEDAPSSVSGLIDLAAEADPHHDTQDSWWGNNGASAVVKVLEFYPNDDGWPVRTCGSIKTPPTLADLDGDGDMEIIVISGNSFLQAYYSDGTQFWTSGFHRFGKGQWNSYPSIPCIGNVCGSELPEVIVDGVDDLLVFSGASGGLLYSFPHPVSKAWRYPHSVCLADLEPESHGEVPRDEIAVVIHNDLYILRVQNDNLEILDEVTMGGTSAMELGPFSWVSAVDLNRTGPFEIVVSRAIREDLISPYDSWLELYDYETGSIYSSREWEGSNFRGIPAVGDLPQSDETIALSRRLSNQTHSSVYLLDPDNISTQVECQPPTEESYEVLCCVMADWDPLASGVDRIIANAENQVMAWYEDGFPVTGWHGNEYPDEGEERPPFPALGNLDNTGYSDLLTGTYEGSIMAFDDEALPLSSLDFPYTLPSFLLGGFTVADIDNDGYVEVVFGTADNYLHVWELGQCTPGYSPWPQCQHDAAKTGILME